MACASLACVPFLGAAVDALAVIPTSVAAAQATANGDELVKAQLVAERVAAHAGEVLNLGLLLDIEPGWHTYWEGRNDTGFAVSLELDLPQGWKAEPMLWPAPSRHLLPGRILDHVYEGRVLLIVPVRVPEDVSEASAQAGMVTIGASVEWLVCKDVCLPGSATLELTLPVQASVVGRGMPELSRHASEFGQARKRHAMPMPKPASEQSQGFSVEWLDSTLIVAQDGARALRFYPRTNCVDLVDVIADGEAKGDELKLRTEAAALAAGGRVRGVLELEFRDGRRRWHSVDLGQGQTDGLEGRRE